MAESFKARPIEDEKGQLSESETNGSVSEQETRILKVTRIADFIKEMVAGLRRENVPAGEDGRLLESEYKGLYRESEIEKDLKGNRMWEAEWFGNAPESEIKARRRLSEGEQLEMLSYAIFAKNLGEGFVVVRASLHDDRKNKVDTLILDRKTGNLVCAFDEVGAASGADYEKKLSNVQGHNLRGGASIKYGLRAKNGNGSVVHAAVENVPIFYIALPPDRIKKGIKEFVLDREKQSEFEKRLFAYFIAAIQMQIKELELYNKRLAPPLKEKVSAFKGIVESLGDSTR